MTLDLPHPSGVATRPNCASEMNEINIDRQTRKGWVSNDPKPVSDETCQKPVLYFGINQLLMSETSLTILYMDINNSLVIGLTH